MLTLHKMNPDVYLYRPPEDTTIEQMNPPELILMFGWINARLRHERKYIEALHRHYPAATILLVKSTGWYWFTTQKQMENTLNPVIDILHSRSWDSILILMFCNGGGWMFTELHRILAKQAEHDSGTSARRGPRVVCVFDSMPGDGALDSGLAFAAPANPLLYLISVPFLATIIGVWTLVNTLRGNPSLFSYRHTLHSHSLLPTVTHASDSQPQRLYVYSLEDRMVHFRPIERHIEEAKGMGLAVSVEKYEGTPHVGHMRSDEQRYWSAVDSLWTRAKL